MLQRWPRTGRFATRPASRAFSYRLGDHRRRDRFAISARQIADRIGSKRSLDFEQLEPGPARFTRPPAGRSRSDACIADFALARTRNVGA